MHLIVISALSVDTSGCPVTFPFPEAVVCCSKRSCFLGVWVCFLSGFGVCGGEPVSGRIVCHWRRLSHLDVGSPARNGRDGSPQIREKFRAVVFGILLAAVGE